jgi:hypothetical protein
MWQPFWAPSSDTVCGPCPSVHQISRPSAAWVLHSPAA